MSLNSSEIENIAIQEQTGIPFDYTIKHSLQNSWTLWYYENDGQTNNWEDNLKEIASFNIVEDFWSLFNYTKQPSELKSGCDYALFKNGIKPMWEDVANSRGGRWMIHFHKKRNSKDVDIMWLNLMLCLIEEGFDNSNEVCGATVNIRNKGHKIGLWTADATNIPALLEIAYKLKERLLIKHKIHYQIHQDSMNKLDCITYTV